MTRKSVARILLLALVLALLAPSALAATASIKKVEYEGGGKVEVDFKRDVEYKNVKLTVKDGSGKKVSARILEKDDDDLDFFIPDIKPDTKYSFTLSGVRAGHSGKFGKVKGSFTTPGDASTQVRIKEVEGEVDDAEVEVEFNGPVQYKKLKVTVADASGSALKVKVRKKKGDELKLRVKGMVAGQKYTVTVSGVRLKGTTTYQTVSAVFVAKAD